MYGILYKSIDWFIYDRTSIMKELTALNNKFDRIRREERE